MTRHVTLTLAASHAELLAALSNVLPYATREAAALRSDEEILQANRADRRIAKARRAIRNAEELPPEDARDRIAIVWNIDDVQELRPDLTDEQAREVLQQAQDRHDAGIGINWDVLEIHADELFPKESA